MEDRANDRLMNHSHSKNSYNILETKYLYL
mgnify:CR=1 FL=1